MTDGYLAGTVCATPAAKRHPSPAPRVDSAGRAADHPPARTADPNVAGGNSMAAKREAAERPYADLHDHLAALDREGLLRRIDRPVDKDTELHPLVRWQFRGGIPEAERKAFLFTNVVDARGRRYDIPVVVGALATNPEIYRIGMGVPVAEIGARWQRAIQHPIPPRRVDRAPCQEIVIEGAALAGEGNGLDALPVPISTPGYDSAPYLTATNCISADPDSGVQNMGTYRAQLKAPDRLGIKLFVSLRQGALTHWRKYKARGRRMPFAVVVGCPPAVAYCGPQKLADDVDELAVAGGIVGAPINVVRARTSDLLVPAESEIVIEGFLDTEYLEPEGPFGESHGHVNLEEYNFVMEVAAITRRRDAVLPSIISQVTPSESSVIKRVAYEPMFLEHLRDHLGIRGVRRVSMHEPLTNLRPVIMVQFERGVAPTEIWRALYATAAYQAPCGKYVIAVNEDIDPDNGDAVFWAMAYRANPEADVAILRHRGRGHAPRGAHGASEESTLLIDATLKDDAPPVSLPTRPYMERARELWEKLGLPPLAPESPWHGYSLGDWPEEAEAVARRAVEGRYLETGRLAHQRRRRDVAPNTPTREAGER
jgi:4-hydroxy-3-polyprenylbenzoate decarboxylase